MKGALKVIFKTGPLTFLTLSLGALMVKTIAVVFGPAGVGVFSLLRQTQQTFVSVATLNGDTALIQGISALTGAEKEDYLVTVAKLFLINSVITSLVFYFFTPLFATWIFSGSDINSVGLIRWILVPSFFACVNVFLLGVMNGYRAVGKMALAQTAAAFVGAVSVYPLLQGGDRDMFIVLLALISITNFAISYYIVLKNKWLNPLFANFFKPLNRNYVIHFFSISGVAVFVGFSGAGTLLLVRLAVNHYFGIESAGIFDVAWTLSSMYLMVFLSSFGTFFLPELSNELDKKIFNNKIGQMMHLSIVVSVSLILLVISLKPLMVATLYSAEFVASLKMIRWMLIGDYLKVMAWVFSMPLLARKHMNVYLLFSILWNLIFTIAALVSIAYFNSIEYIGISYLIAQLMYVIYAFEYWRRLHSLYFSKSIWVLWICGALAICTSSLIHWNEEKISLVSVFFCCIFISFFIWFGLGVSGRNDIRTLISPKLNR